MKSKKILGVGLLAVVLALSSCMAQEKSSSAESTPTSSGESGSSAPAPVYDPVGGYEDIDNWTDAETGQLKFDADGNVVYENVNLNMMTLVNGVDLAGLVKVVTQFNKDYSGKIKVTVENEGQGSFETSLTTRITTGIGVPEMMMFHNENFPSLQRNHYFQPIDRVIEKSHIDFKESDFASGVAKNNRVANKLFGVSTDAHSMVMLYRQDLLDKYDLDMPKNFNELLNAAYTIQQGEIDDGETGFKGISMSTTEFGIYQYLFYTAILQNGGTLLDSKNARPNWNENAGVKTAIEEFKELFYGPKAVATYGLAVGQSDTDFATGKCAFAFNYTWMLDEIFRTFDKHFDEEDRGISSLSGLFAKDATAECANKIYGISHGIYIPKNITDITKKAATVEFMKYFSEHSVAWNDWGHIPTNIKYSQSEEYLSSEGTVSKTQFYGNIQDYENFQFNYFLTVATGGLDNIFTFATKEAGSNVDSIINKYTKEANNTINMLIG